MIKRKSFAKLKETYGLPNLLDVQLDTYREFLQIETPVGDRKNQGLQEVFGEIFPIESPDRSVKLEFISYSLGKPKYTMSEAKNRSLTYAAPKAIKESVNKEEAAEMKKKLEAAGATVELK